MLKYVALIAPLTLFLAAPAHAQRVEELIDNAGFFADKARKETDEAIFYFKHNRDSYACTFLGSALSYSNRGIASLREARQLARDSATIRRIDGYLNSMNEGRNSILEAGRICPNGLSDYDGDDE